MLLGKKTLAHRTIIVHHVPLAKTHNLLLEAFPELTLVHSWLYDSPRNRFYHLGKRNCETSHQILDKNSENGQGKIPKETIQSALKLPWCNSKITKLELDTSAKKNSNKDW